MDDDELQPPSQANEALTAALAGSAAAAYIRTLPSNERRMATMAAEGSPVWEIAQVMRVSDAAVWRTLNGVVAAVSGQEIQPVETGGFGSDTDPGVTGGYGNTGFGALDTEPLPYNEEPDEGDIVPREPAGADAG